jgi:hypothetical protein
MAELNWDKVLMIQVREIISIFPSTKIRLYKILPDKLALGFVMQ